MPVRRCGFSHRQNAVDETVRAIRRANRKREAESLSPEDIRVRMTRAIAECVGERGAVTREDFLRAGIPATAIQPNFKACLARAREQHPGLGKLEVAA